MMETLKKYWFVFLVGVLLAGFLGYYVYDLNKDNVSGKTSDGKDVVASLSIGDITSEDLFDEYEQFSDAVLYNLYRNAIIDQSIETTDDLKDQQKSFARNIEANVDSDATGQTRIDVITELASFGFVDMDQLPDYCMMYLKSRELDRQFVSENLDRLADVLSTSPKTISLIKMDIEDAEALSDDELEKQTDIDAAIEADGFDQAAKEFSDDTATADKLGFYGYVDQNSSDLDASILEAIQSMTKGQVTDWITVSDATTGASSLYKVRIEEDNFRDIFLNSDEETQNDALSALISADNVIEIRAVESRAKDFEITFGNEDVEKRIKDYIASQLERDAYTFDEAVDEQEADPEQTQEDQEDIQEDEEVVNEENQEAADE